VTAPAMTEASPQPSGSMASLIGGVAVGIGVAILTVLLAGGPSAFNIGLGVVIGVVLGLWVRLADL
jgi:hypothetical protein